MQKAQKRQKKLLVAWAVIIIVLVIAMIAIGQTFVQSGELLLNNQDKQSYYLARSVDQNLASILEQKKANLEFIINRRGFIEAQEIWQSTGDIENLRYRLEENVLTNDEAVITMMVIYKNEILLSTDGNLDYEFLSFVETDGTVPCKDAFGNRSVALVCTSESELKYAVVLNLHKCYEQIVSEDLIAYEWVLLTDESGQIVLQPEKGNVTVGNLDAITSATYNAEGVNTLLKLQDIQKVGAKSYEYVDGDSGIKHTARIMAIPTNETKNGTFAVAVVTNFDDINNSLNMVTFRFLGYGGLMAIGILLIIRIFMGYRRQNQEDMKELLILKEKNAAMEELNRKTQELAHHQRLETIGTLTSSIAHEFNNLLTPIMGYSILTLEQLPTEAEDLYDNILEIYNASCRASDIISRLSALSRKNTSLSYQQLSLDDVVEKVLHVAVPALPSNIEIEKKLKSNPVKLCANETQLSQMILNLVLNAFHAMEKTGGIVEVSSWVEGEWDVLCIKDMGCGIPEEIIPKIYEPFFTTKEAGKGTGLGLAIVQQVINEHHGKIEVATQVNVGTKFTIYLPLMIDNEKIE